MTACANCGAENQAGALFCEMCGTRLAAAPQPQAPAGGYPAPAPAPAVAGGMISCATCGASAIPGEAFCDNCGATLGAPAPASAAAPLSPPVAASPPPPAQPAPQPVYPPPQPIGAGSSCPACGTPAVPGEAFCDNCGAVLGPQEQRTPYQPMPVPPVAPQSPAPQVYTPSPVPQAPPPPPVAPQPIGLTTLQGMTLEFAGQSLVLPAQGEAILGRQDPASGHFPDIDFSTHGALEHGVGRRHARIFVRGGQVHIEDLDSTNGTLINRQKLKARQPVVLNGGEEVRLGTLAMTFRRGSA